ncbi:DUF6716 putative glycosyltransferase [Demequina sp. SO4-18]|uniref:DUF6716 putative glycosyltransferase n=1 Tax=Demequina sp. SO4-18 TaxID=3401026 RepID=UPI003B5CE5EE
MEPNPHSPRSGRRLLVVADADSYLKWAVTRAREAQGSWDVELVLVDSAVTPSKEQVEAAVGGRWLAPEPMSFADLERRLASDPPDSLLLACRGPLIELVVGTLSRARGASPVTVSGIPGIWMPPTALGVRLRTGTDLMVVHSRRERRAAAALARTEGGPREFALAGLANLAGLAGLDGAPDTAGRAPLTTIVFAPQALVPVAAKHREAIVTALARVARAHPELTVVIKERGRAGEEQTHRDRQPFPRILDSLEDAPGNLVVGYGPMSDYLEPGTALVTVSSTAVLEAIASGVPALCLDDFGVDVENINLVFEGSGLLGSLDDLERLDFRLPRAEWLDDNYFHDPAANDWLEALARVVDAGEWASTGGPQRGGQGGLDAVRRTARRRMALASRDTWWRRPVTWTAAAVGVGLRAWDRHRP